MSGGTKEPCQGARGQLFFSVEWYQEHAARLLGASAFQACQRIPPQIKGIQFLCNHLLAPPLVRIRCHLSCYFNGRGATIDFLFYYQQSEDVISGSPDGPREPLGNFERLLVLQTNLERLFVEAKFGPDDAPGQKTGLVLVEQGVLVATEWRSQELPLANEAAHQTFDIWKTRRGRIQTPLTCFSAQSHTM